ncbi:MAG: hypothetical protein E7449_07215 [Ruminococcaceae bacterium]|nr:hypothetical protein [Oscillospiraceae bacterium]
MEIFKLFGSILINSDEAEASIQKTESKAGKMAEALGNGIKTAAKWGTAIVAGAGAAGAALMGVANKAAESADEVDKMSQKIGLSKEGFQEWRYAMGQSGVDIGVMQNGMKTLTNLMDSAKNGTVSAKNAFSDMGLSIYDSKGALKDQETMMRETIMALAEMEDSTERAKLSTQLFGRAGTELEPLLNSGADGIQNLMDRAHDLGLVMSDDAVNAGVVFGDTLADVKDSLGMVATNVGVQVMPVIQGLLDWVIAHMPEIQATVSKVMDGIKAGIEALQAFWAEHGDAISAKVEQVMDIIGKVVKVAMDVLKKVIDTAMAIMKGDWSAAWDGIVGIVKSIGTALFDAGKAIFSRLWDGIKSVWDSIAGWVSEKVSWLLDKLTFWDNGTSRMNSEGFSHASGLAYVPYDNYPAILHRGEMVLNANTTNNLLEGMRSIMSDSVNAFGLMNGGATRLEIPISINGREFYRATIDDLRMIQRSNPEVVSR